MSPSSLRTANDVAEISEFPATLSEGEVAPPLPAALFGDGVNAYSGGFPHTRVVVFVTSFCDAERADEADLERIRAEVRGLSATLLVIAPKGSWCFGPDDRLFKRVLRSEGRDEPLTTAFQRFGVPEHGGRDGLRAAFVVDGDGTIRFADVKSAAPQGASASRPSKDSVLRALVIAADEMERALKGPGRPSPDDATAAGLVAGFKKALASPNTPQPRARLADQTATW